jgi:hypothetical protein
MIAIIYEKSEFTKLPPSSSTFIPENADETLKYLSKYHKQGEGEKLISQLIAKMCEVTHSTGAISLLKNNNIHVLFAILRP